MKIIPQFYGVIEKGILKLDHPDRWKTYLKAISGPITLILKRPRKNRTLKENNYYWFILTLIAEETGATPEEMHNAFKWLFLRKQIGKIFTVNSTAILDTLAFEDYVEKIRVFAQTDLNIKVPLPNEYEP